MATITLTKSVTKKKHWPNCSFSWGSIDHQLENLNWYNICWNINHFSIADKAYVLGRKHFLSLLNLFYISCIIHIVINLMKQLTKMITWVPLISSPMCRRAGWQFIFLVQREEPKGRETEKKQTKQQQKAARIDRSLTRRLIKFCQRLP